MILNARATARLKPPAIASSSLKGNIAARLWNGVVQNSLKADVDVQLPKGLHAVLKSLDHRKIPQFYRDSSIGLCRVLSDQEQIDNPLKCS